MARPQNGTEGETQLAVAIPAALSLTPDLSGPMSTWTIRHCLFQAGGPWSRPWSWEGRGISQGHPESLYGF